MTSNASLPQTPPRTPPCRCRATTPPALPHVGTSLRSALSAGHAQMLKEMLSYDDTLVHVPMRTNEGYEVPLIAAIKMGCGAPVLEVLIHHGAVPKAHGRCGAPALHIIVGLFQEGRGPTEQPTWTNKRSHLVNWFQSELGGHLAVARQVLPFFDPGFEQQACAAAACLLYHGADATERWMCCLPAEVARRSGQHRLASVIEHFAWRRVQRMLSKHVSAACSTRRSGFPLRECPVTAGKLISEFLSMPQ